MQNPEGAILEWIQNDGGEKEHVCKKDCIAEMFSCLCHATKHQVSPLSLSKVEEYKGN